MEDNYIVKDVLKLSNSLYISHSQCLSGELTTNIIDITREESIVGNTIECRSLYYAFEDMPFFKTLELTEIISSLRPSAGSDEIPRMNYSADMRNNFEEPILKELKKLLPLISMFVGSLNP